MTPMESNEDLKRDDDYSQRGSKGGKGAAILGHGSFKNTEKPADEIYHLDPLG